MSNGRTEAKALNRSDFDAFQTISKDFITASLPRALLADPFRTCGTRPRAFHDHDREIEDEEMAYQSNPIGCDCFSDGQRCGMGG
jgi:hypothetical protein